MKVTSVDISTVNPDNVVNLSFRDPRNQNPYQVKTILGLDADEIVPKFNSMNDVFTKYYDLSLQKRDVVLQIGLNPNFSDGKTYSELRDDLYKLIASSRTGAVSLTFKDGTEEVAGITGFITKFESQLFAKAPEVSITINCTDPMLKAVVQTNVPVAELDPLMTTIVDDKSTAPHGVRFGFIFTDVVSDFYIQDAEVPSWVFHVSLTGSSLVEFEAGDELHFSSEHNNRYLYIIRDLEIIQIVDKVIPTSIWPIMFPGSNDFICSENVNWDYITYYPTYWGV